MNQPSLPPSSFALPAPHVTYEVLDPKTAKKTGKTRRKKIQEWRWVDKEWSVQLSVPASGSSSASPAASRAAKGDLKASEEGIKSPTVAGEVHETIGTNKVSIKAPSAISAIAGQREEVDLFRDYVVDSEGWMYGDNHFEKMSAKGGLGKYTRRRAWVRKAALVERVELVGDEDKGKSTISANGSVATSKESAAGAKLNGEAASTTAIADDADAVRRRRRRSTNKSVSPSANSTPRKAAATG